MAERRCPACGKPVELKDMAPLIIKRKQPPVTLYVCKDCYITTRSVLKMLKPYFPDAIVLEHVLEH